MFRGRTSAETDRLERLGARSSGRSPWMMHLDVGVSWAEAQGAVLSHHQPQDAVRVMLDPEGHPFCLFLDDSL
ncbi:VOC family protein [Ilumatobacter nonamiensis]|uniref:VOC family protein n=1 Tax=Ilumatobacter nonamiensis TaxID=467093 RepID=UPI0006876F97|nr:VOC family protein [Ilumatobacter nonamiensis]